jgi:hypothetical protein
MRQRSLSLPVFARTHVCAWMCVTGGVHRMYAHVSEYIYIYFWAREPVCVHTCVHTSVCTCMCVPAFMIVHARVYVWLFVWVHHHRRLKGKGRLWLFSQEPVDSRDSRDSVNSTQHPPYQVS